MADETSFDSDLLCDEETIATSFALDDNGAKQGIEPPALPCLTDECIAFMAERQSDHMPKFDYLQRFRNGELDLQLRKEALDWIFKTCAHFSFGELCLYTAITYFDRILSIYDSFQSSFNNGGKNWQIQLLAVACLSLAAKMEEIEVPSIFDLQEGVPKLMFEGKTVQRMEVLVLTGLKWKIKAYTPCNFIDYYLRKLNDNKFPSANVIARSLQIILSTFQGIEFLEFKPSEIAAAVAMYVSREIEEAKDIDNALSCLIGVEKGRVLKCLEMIEESSPVDVTITSSSAASSSATSNRAISFPSSPNGVLEAACLSYKRDEPSKSPESKRRKLDQTSTSGGDS